MLTGNASQSAINAGYTSTYATTRIYEMLENVRIKAYISEKSVKLVKKVDENIEEIKLLSNFEVAEIKDKLLSIMRSEEPLCKYTKHFRYDKKTRRKHNYSIEEIEEDNLFLKVKAIEGLFKLQTVVLQTKEKLDTLKPKIENIELKNEEMKNKISSFEDNNIEGVLDVLDGLGKNVQVDKDE